MHDELVSILPRVRRFAVNLTGNRPDADDLLQIVVERLLDRPIPQDADLLKWSFRICRNAWIDEIRARQVRQHAAEDTVLQPVHEHGEKTAMTRLTLQDVDMAMRDLPDNQRVAISLVAVEGFSYADAAEVLGVPVGTIMSRVSRARKALAAIFTTSGGSASIMGG